MDGRMVCQSPCGMAGFGPRGARDCPAIRMHGRQLPEGIGEYNTYKDPSSTVPVRGTIHNNHVWKFGDGRYFSTNDPNFKPGNRVELKRVP